MTLLQSVSRKFENYRYAYTYLLWYESFLFDTAVDKKAKNVYVCLSLNDAIYHEMLYQQMRMSTYVKSNAYVVLKSSTTDRCTIVSFLTNR